MADFYIQSMIILLWLIKALLPVEFEKLFTPRQVNLLLAQVNHTQSYIQEYRTLATFTFHTIETAPDGSKPLLEDSVKNFGMIPNLHAVMAESPVVLEAYKLLHEFFQKTSFDKDELTVVWQTINIEHECHYCVPAHTMIAGMMGVDQAITDALRNKGPLPSAKLQALHNMTLSMTRNRGRIQNSEMEAFFEAGYTQRHMLEIALGLSQKVMSNYVNHFSETPVDSAFAEFAWEPAKTA